MTHCCLPSAALIEEYLSVEIARKDPRRRSRSAQAKEVSLLFPLCPISSLSCIFLIGVRGGGTLCTVFNRPALIQRENIVENILEHLNILEMSFKDLFKLKNIIII